MSFFKSDIVRGDIQEMMELQQFCFRSAMNFILLDSDRKLEYFEALEKLIDKQKVLKKYSFLNVRIQLVKLRLKFFLSKYLDIKLGM